MRQRINHRKAGYVRIRVFWLTSIILSLLLTLLLNAVIFLFHH